MKKLLFACLISSTVYGGAEPSKGHPMLPIIDQLTELSTRCAHSSGERSIMQNLVLTATGIEFATDDLLVDTKMAPPAKHDIVAGKKSLRKSCEAFPPPWIASSSTKPTKNLGREAVALRNAMILRLPPDDFMAFTQRYLEHISQKTTMQSK